MQSIVSRASRPRIAGKMPATLCTHHPIGWLFYPDCRIRHKISQLEMDNRLVITGQSVYLKFKATWNNYQEKTRVS